MKMKNELKVFTNELFGNVRVVVIDNKVWFVGRDVVGDLGYRVDKSHSYTDYIGKFVKEKYQLKMNNREMGLFGMSDASRKGEILINEYGVIQLVMSSKLPQAEQFQYWIVEEVIPSILQTGTYSTQPNMPQSTQEQTMILDIFEKRNDPPQFALALGGYPLLVALKKSNEELNSSK